MTIQLRTILFAFALAFSTAIAVSPLLAQQSNTQETGATKSGQASAVKQEFGPQTAARRGDRMGVVGNSNHGASSQNGSAASHPAHHANAKNLKKHNSHPSQPGHSTNSPSDSGSSK